MVTRMAAHKHNTAVGRLRTCLKAEPLLSFLIAEMSALGLLDTVTTVCGVVFSSSTISMESSAAILVLYVCPIGILLIAPVTVKAFVGLRARQVKTHTELNLSIVRYLLQVLSSRFVQKILDNILLNPMSRMSACGKYYYYSLLCLTFTLILSKSKVSEVKFSN